MLAANRRPLGYTASINYTRILRTSVSPFKHSSILEPKDDNRVTLDYMILFFDSIERFNRAIVLCQKKCKIYMLSVSRNKLAQQKV